MSSLIIRNATVRNGDKRVSVIITDGELSVLEGAGIDTEYPRIEADIDAEGGLLLPGFVDAHTHLDKAYAAPGEGNTDMDSLDAVIQHAREAKASFTVDNVHDRAVRAIRTHVRHGCTRIRTHVDVDTVGGLVPFEGVRAARDTCREIADVEIVAFPQEGIFRDPGTETLLGEALDSGADVIGGMPFAERTDRDQHAHVDLCLELAAKHAVPVDMHIDETDDPNARSLEYLSARYLEEGLNQPVTASHACALAAYDPAHAARVIDLVAEAGVHVITNPGTNLIHQGSHDTYPKRRGLTRVDELMKAGVTVAAAQDNMGDGFYPYGRGDMVEVALLAAHALQLATPTERSSALDLVTTSAADVTGFDSHGVREAAPATITLFPPSIRSPGDVIRTGSLPRLVFHRGELVATNTSNTVFSPDVSSVAEP